LVLDVEIRGAISRKRKVGVSKVRWWNLKEENAVKSLEKIKGEGN